MSWPDLSPPRRVPDLLEELELERHREGPAAGVTYLRVGCWYCPENADEVCAMCERPTCPDCGTREGHVLVCPECSELLS
jgi:hypothetical protein